MRVIALVVATLAMPAVVHAEIVAKGVRIGGGILGGDVKKHNGGTSFGNGFNGQPGFAGGTFIRNAFTPSFSLQLELDLSQKRFDEEDCTSVCMDLGTASIWYLQVPALLRFDLLPGDGTKFHLDVGPELVASLGGTRRGIDGGSRPFNLVTGNVGIIAGVGIDVRGGPGHVTFDVRYSRWLAPIANSGVSGDDTNIEPSHQLYASVGYAFP